MVLALLKDWPFCKIGRNVMVPQKRPFRVLELSLAFNIFGMYQYLSTICDLMNLILDL